MIIDNKNYKVVNMFYFKSSVLENNIAKCCSEIGKGENFIKYNEKQFPD